MALQDLSSAGELKFSENKMLSMLIMKGHVVEATGIVNGLTVNTVPSSAVDSNFMSENTRGQILWSKKGSVGKKKVVTRDGAFGKSMRLEHPYDKLELCR